MHSKLVANKDTSFQHMHTAKTDQFVHKFTERGKLIIWDISYSGTDPYNTPF